MSHPEIIETTYPEELYAIPPKPVVAISSAWNMVSDADKALLEKILGAVKLSIKNVKMVHTDQLNVLKWVDKPSHVLAFGLEMTGFSLYEPFEVQDIKIIIAPTLSALDSDKDGKQKLWAGLKKMFG